jgi:hypothetical protein
MKTKTRLIVVLALLASLFLVTMVLAAPTATTVDRYVIGGGGGDAGGGIYALKGTIGQPVVGGTISDPYELGSGFWGGMGAVAGAPYTIYLPVVTHNHSW